MTDRLPRVLMITSVWPTAAHPEHAPFVVRQVEFLRRRGMEVEVVHVAGQGRATNYVRRRREVRRLMASRSFDVIHAQWGQAALIALPPARPLVITFRGSDLEGIAGTRFTGRALTAASRFAARFADEIIVVSSSLARHLPGRRCHVIPSGLDLEVFRPLPRADARARLGLDQGATYVLFAASPANPVKRHPLAAAAVRTLHTRHRAELLVASGVAPALMPLYMSACDALLLTSSHEGSPNVVKEALACNLPVVAVDVGDVRERLTGVEGCAVVGDDRPEALAAGLETVLGRGLPIAGRAAVADLDEARLTEQVLAVYQRAIAARS